MFRSIRIKYTLLVLIPIVAIALLSLARDLMLLHRDVRDAKRREVESEAVLEASRLDSYFETVERAVGVMASALSREHVDSADRAFAMLESTMEGNPGLSGATIAFLPEHGRLFAPTVLRQGDRLARVDLANHLDYTEEQWEWYRIATRDRRAHWTEPYARPGTKKVYVTSFSAPFYRDDRLAGVVSVDVELDALQSVAVPRPGAKSWVLVTAAGEVATGDAGLLDRARSSRSDDQLSYALKLTRHEGPGTVMLQDSDGPAVAVFVPVQRAGWSLGWQVPESLLLATEKRQLATRAGTELLTLLGAAVAMWVVMGWITAPVLKLRDQMDQFAKGQELKELPPTREDELGDLFYSFHTMSEVLLDREEQIQDLESQRFNVLVDNLPGAVYRLSAGDRRVEFVSERIEGLSGHPSRDFLEGGRRLESVILPADREASRTAIEEAVKGRRPWKIQYRFQHRDGRTLWVEDTGQAILGTDGAPEWLDGILLDVTQQRQVHEVIEESRRRMQAVIDNAADSIYLKDLDGRYLMVNRSFGNFVGLEPDQVVGKLDTDLFPPELAAARRDRDREVINSRQASHFEQQVEGKTFLVSKIPLLSSEGEAYAVSSFATDITERKAMEDKLLGARLEADAANRAKSEFLARMSHEIRTPMNAVIGLCHLALTAERNAKQRDYLHKIQSSAQSLLAVINELGTLNDVLDFNKLEAGERALEQDAFNLVNVLDDVIGLFTVKAAEKGLEMFYVRDPDVPDALVGSPLRLRQVLTNLVSNAVKFTENGDIVVRCGVQERDEDSVRLRFTVQDTGQGMSQRQLMQLFQPQSGLGLMICKRLVEMMGGAIEVVSRPGQGSTFTFTVSCGLQKGVPARPAAQLDLKGTRVLVVDDRDTARQILAEMLRSMEFEVESAASGPEALARLDQGSFEVILMDWRMSGMSGQETSRQIHQRFAGKKRPYILMVTSYGRDSDADSSTLEELDGFVLKPVTPGLLFEAVARVLGGESREPEPLLLSSGSVLVAEDDEINQQVARELLTHLGMRVSLAANGQEALEALAREPFDLVLMDLQMPVLDGFEATRRIRSDKNLKGLPIIAMTAHAMVGDRERCLEVGMNDHLAKPIDPRALRAALARWMTPADGLPALPGVETAQGLSRVGGNVKLYRKLLGDFRDRYASVCAELRASSPQEATALAHKLAGVAANLGMASVASAARSLEQASRSGKVENGLLETLDKTLAGVLPALERLQPAATVAAGPVENAPEKLRALLELLRQGDPAAQGRLEELTPVLVGQPELPSLTAQVGNLDFEEAAQTLKNILEVMQ